MAVIDALRGLAPDDPRVVAVEQAAAHLRKAAKKQRRLARKHVRVERDRALAVGSARAAAYFGVPAAPPAEARVLRAQRRCYVCKHAFRELHAFYHMLCPACAERHFAARGATADLTGRRAIVTGGRIKIGFEVACALLRAGATVTITTRFPNDARRRFAEAGLGDRLEIAGLDFRDLRSVLGWIDGELADGRPLDILINNAAQTVRRPPAYDARLVAAERAALAAPDLPASANAGRAPGAHGPPNPQDAANLGPDATPDPQHASGFAPGAQDASQTAPGAAPGDLVAQVRDALLFPAGVDEEGKPLDLRPINSWILGAADVEPVELVEVHLINAIAPFLLASRLRPLFGRSAFADRYIVNVSAMEGVFAYGNKQPRHPHTNMAKAALNMFTRTSAADYVRDGIYMNSVDTGWITQENPWPHKQRAEAAGFCPPLDVLDGAARVLAPVLRGVAGAPVAGMLFKDYEPAAW